MSRGRPNNYDKKVKPFLAKISELSTTMTDEQIAEYLEVGTSTFARYKKNEKELRDAIKKGRKLLVIELRKSLIDKAKGYEYVETKIIEERNEEGILEIVRKETQKKRAHADVAAINLLLKNYDAENWANDPQALELKKQELELQKQKIEEGQW